MFSMVAPPPSSLSTMPTVTRMPRMIGLPPMIAGSCEIRSKPMVLLLPSQDRSRPVGNPDVLDLGGFGEEVVAFKAPVGEVVCEAAGGPGLLEISNGGLFYH